PSDGSSGSGEELPSLGSGSLGSSSPSPLGVAVGEGAGGHHPVWSSGPEGSASGELSDGSGVSVGEPSVPEDSSPSGSSTSFVAPAPGSSSTMVLPAQPLTPTNTTRRVNPRTIRRRIMSLAPEALERCSHPLGPSPRSTLAQALGSPDTPRGTAPWLLRERVRRAEPRSRHPPRRPGRESLDREHGSARRGLLPQRGRRRLRARRPRSR